MKGASATFLLAITLALEANAESRLPPCPEDRNVVWNNCQGTTFPEGDHYVGEFKDGEPNGQGTYTWLNRDKYIGEFKDGEPNGQGTHTWPNGDKYIGEFKDGQPNGQGTVTWRNGEEYVGKFKDGKANGQGTHFWPDGHKYVGEFKDGKSNGYGTLYSSNGAEQWGVWKDGILVGSSAENSSNKAITPALQLPEKTNGDLPGAIAALILSWIAIAAIFLMKDKTEPSVRVQQDEQKREKEEAEAAARKRQGQQEEQYRRHGSSSGKMSTDQALEILGLKSGSTEEEIRAAYNRLMKRVHPDVGGSSVFASQLNRARDALIE